MSTLGTPSSGVSISNDAGLLERLTNCVGQYMPLMLLLDSL
jgi:hypothetical protein